MVGQNLQRRLDFGEHFNLVPRMQKHFETLVGQCRRLVVGVPGIFHGVKQHAAAQGADAVFQARLIAQHALTNRPQMLDRHCAEVRCVLSQPLAQHGFGADDHRGGVPQSVVEVEGDQLDCHDSSPLIRLARGWALS